MKDLVRRARQVGENAGAAEVALTCRARDGHHEGLRPGSAGRPAPSAAYLAADAGLSQLRLRRPVVPLQSRLQRLGVFHSPLVLRISVATRKEPPDLSLQLHPLVPEPSGAQESRKPRTTEVRLRVALNAPGSRAEPRRAVSSIAWHRRSRWPRQTCPLDRSNLR
jgi:hypothetical protein